MKFDNSISKIRTVLDLFKTAVSTKKCTNNRSTFYDFSGNETDFKKQTSKLKISEEHFRFALKASSTGSWDWDLRENTIFFCLKSKIILELESITFNNSECWDKIIHPDDLEKYYAKIQKHFDKKTSFYENHHRIITSSGKYKWVLVKGKVIERDLQGRSLRVIGNLTDISLQKERELELKKKNGLYRQQTKRLMNFCNIASHNLNSHISNIKMLLDINDLKDDASNTELLIMLRTVSNDLNDTIGDLNQIVSIQNNVDIIIKPLAINFYLRKVIALINGYNYNVKAEIINNITEESIVNFNPAYLESILLNFSTNAIKYAHPDRSPIIKFDFFIENKKKTLTITDNGLGIDLEKYGNVLFGMYKTFHKNNKARGLGLYMTKNQIEALKGKVSVTSKVGEGTTFKIIFSD